MVHFNVLIQGLSGFMCDTVAFKKFLQNTSDIRTKTLALPQIKQLRPMSLNMLVVKLIDILGRDRGLIRQQLDSPWAAWCQQPNVVIPCVPSGHKIGPNWVVNPTQFSVQISFPLLR